MLRFLPALLVLVQTRAESLNVLVEVALPPGADVPESCLLRDSSVPYLRYPRQYVAPAVGVAGAPTLDGRLDDAAWAAAPWTEDFVDIATSTAPHLRTRAKIVWDEEFLHARLLRLLQQPTRKPFRLSRGHAPGCTPGVTQDVPSRIF